MTVSANYVSASSPDRSLTRYIQETRAYPMLSPEEEIKLANLWRKRKDRRALDKLVTSHLRLVVKTAMGFRGYGQPISDLIAAGNVGLMRAVKRFDADRGFRFSTYALWWIRSSIQEYILHSWSLVKVGTTGTQKKLFFNLRKVKSQMHMNETDDLAPENVARIADLLNVPESEVIDMNRRMAGPDNSLNAPVGDEDGGMQWLDWIEDPNENQEARLSQNQETTQRRRELTAAMDGLTERERHILVNRRLAEVPPTLEHLSRRYGISPERVRQIEMRAFEKVQKHMVSAAHRTPPSSAPQ
jgi:RNA polymerase sigma-32 factor